MSPRPKGSKNLKSDKTRERIFEAAMDLFHAQGFSDTTMRQIAEEAKVALGATYYYFRSKNDIVLCFYRELQAGDQAFLATRGFMAAKGLGEKLKGLIRHKLGQLQAHRNFLDGVFRNANDPESPLSPFGEETRDIRENNIANIEKIVAEAGANIHESLRKHLPRLLWYYQMGIILFWFYDKSPGQAQSRTLLDKSLKFIMLAIRLFGLPLLAPMRKAALDLLETFMGILDKPGRTE